MIIKGYCTNDHFWNHHSSLSTKIIHISWFFYGLENPKEKSFFSKIIYPPLKKWNWKWKCFFLQLINVYICFENLANRFTNFLSLSLVCFNMVLKAHTMLGNESLSLLFLKNKEFSSMIHCFVVISLNVCKNKFILKIKGPLLFLGMFVIGIIFWPSYFLIPTIIVVFGSNNGVFFALSWTL